MQTKEYELYVENNIKLVRSICIKSQQIITATNYYLDSVGIDTSTLDIEQYKYFVNLRGLYWTTAEYLPQYAANTMGDDEIMYFTPIENNTLSIEFNPTNLALYPDSLNEFRKFGNYYKELQYVYSNQLNLIKRIIDPIPEVDPITNITIYDELDGKILFYDNRLIADNEWNIIPKLQIWIYNWISRWENKGYVLTDQLYAASSCGTLRLQLLPTIMNLRLENIKTPQVCDFHLWSYLGSYFELDRFKDYLTIDQALFLYKNIEYIVATAGSKETFLFLYENLVKGYGLTMNAYDLRQDSGQLSSELRNTVVVNKYPVDSNNLQEVSTTVITVEELIENIKEQAKLNSVFQIEDADNVKRKVLQSDSPIITTGIIEMEKEHDPSKGMVDHFDELLTYWFYLAANDKFNYQYRLFIDSNTDKYITAKEAAILMLYISTRFKLFDPWIEDNTIFSDNKAIPNVLLTNLIDGDLYSDYSTTISMVGTAEQTTDDILNNTLNSIMSNDLYNSIIGDSTNTFIEEFKLSNLSISNIVDLNTLAKKSEMIKMRMKLAITLFEDHVHRSMIENSYRALLMNYDWNISANYGPNGTWKDFLDSIDLHLDLENIGKEGLKNLADDIFKHFVGNLKIQEGMSSPHYEIMQIMRLLTSYTTMIIPGDASANAKPLNFPTLGLKRISSTINFKYKIDLWCPNIFVKTLVVDDTGTANDYTVENNEV